MRAPPGGQSVHMVSEVWVTACESAGVRVAEVSYHLHERHGEGG